MSDDNPDGTRKPDLPPNLSPGGSSEEENGEDSSGTKKPDLPPGLGDSGDNAPSGTKPPAGPGGDDDGPTLPPGFGGDGATADEPELTRKDFQTDQEVRWCPGCGDYVVLAQVQRLLPELDVDKENLVFISGIGCAGRFPYYMNTYGVHSIHGRAPAFATGLKTARPELDVWIVTGDGDALSIGGNHFIHVLRRNLDTQILLFNNEIYGLTKGQYSPTSERGKVTKSSPYGSVDYPFNPVTLALGADASFVARTLDRDPKHMQAILKRAHAHKGASFIEIYQNCNIFNDGAFFAYTEKDSKPANAVFLEEGKPMLFDEGRRGLRLDGLTLQVVDLESERWSADDCLVHDESSAELASIVGRLFRQPDMPRPFGVLYREDRPTYESMLHAQLDDLTQKRGKGDLAALLGSGDTWEI